MPHLTSRTHRGLFIIVVVVACAAAAGMVALWPDREQLPDASDELEELVLGEIVGYDEYDVVLPTAEMSDHLDDHFDDVWSDVGDGFLPYGDSGRRADIQIELRDGPNAGELILLEGLMLDGYPELASGDRVLLDRVPDPSGGVQYLITDLERSSTLWLLVGLFLVAVIAVGRWHGLRSLLGLGLSLVIVVAFVVPAILAGRSPALVALVGAVTIMIITLYLVHGVNEMTTAAIVGTTAALVITVGLGVWFVSQSRITGFASDDAIFASFAVGGLDLQGLVLAGLIIAALGVLDDVTISQASTVFVLHDTDPSLRWTTLFGRAMRVGRDHIASVVNTLFLAYAGASLALLVLFSTSGVSTAELLNSEIIAEELVKIIVGSLGLIAAVPITTALAAKVAIDRSRPTSQLTGSRGDGTTGAAAAHGRAAVADAGRE